jgi:hypothetical protein
LDTREDGERRGENVTIEGRIESIGINKAGIKYAVVEVKDIRFKEETDIIHIPADDDWQPGKYIFVIVKLQTEVKID